MSPDSRTFAYFVANSVACRLRTIVLHCRDRQGSGTEDNAQPDTRARQALARQHVRKAPDRSMRPDPQPDRQDRESVENPMSKAKDRQRATHQAEDRAAADRSVCRYFILDHRALRLARCRSDWSSGRWPRMYSSRRRQPAGMNDDDGFRLRLDRRTGPSPVRSKLQIAVEAVKDQRTARLARHAGASNHELNAMPTQNALKTQPVTLVHDQFRSAMPHFQPATSTASIVSPIARS